MDQREWVDRLFQECAKELFHYLCSFRLSEDDTYDLVQETYVILLDAKQSRIRNPKVWLFTVGRNLAINTLKRRKRRAESPDVEALADESPGALSHMLKEEEWAGLWQAFRMLPSRDQEMMELSLEHEFSYREIATLLGKSEISVRVAMHRSRKRLSNLLRTVDGQSKETQEKGDGDDPKGRPRAEASTAS